MKYIIIKEQSINKLVGIVNEKISDGYEPQGGFLESDDGYYQAMIKKEV